MAEPEKQNGIAVCIPRVSDINVALTTTQLLQIHTSSKLALNDHKMKVGTKNSHIKSFLFVQLHRIITLYGIVALYMVSFCLAVTTIPITEFTSKMH